MRRRARAARVVVCALWSGLSVVPVQAQPSALLGRTNPLAQLLPTPMARTGAERARLERELTHLLEAVPGVVKTELVLSLPARDALPLDRALPPTRAGLLITFRGTAPDPRPLRALVTRVLGPDSEVALTLSREAIVSPRAIPAAGAVPKKVGPFWVSAQSAGWLRATLAACLLANAALAALLLRQRRRR